MDFFLWQFIGEEYDCSLFTSPFPWLPSEEAIPIRGMSKLLPLEIVFRLSFYYKDIKITATGYRELVQIKLFLFFILFSGFICRFKLPFKQKSHSRNQVRKRMRNMRAGGRLWYINLELRL